MAEGGKNQWAIWTIVIAAIIITFFAFNYQGEQAEDLSLTEIFHEDQPQESANVEYKFVDKDNNVVQQVPLPATHPIQKSAFAPQPVPAKTIAPKMAAPPMPTITPMPSASEVKAQMAAGTTYYTIQAVSSKDKAAIEKALEKAKASGFGSAFLVTHDLGEKGVWYRIYMGRFETKAQADEYLPTVRNNYADAFVKASKN